MRPSSRRWETLKDTGPRPRVTTLPALLVGAMDVALLERATDVPALLPSGRYDAVDGGATVDL